MSIAQEVKKAWNEAKKNNLDCFDAVDRALKDATLTDYQRGYITAKLEEIGNCLSSEQEDWLWEVEEALENLQIK